MQVDLEDVIIARGITMMPLRCVLIFIGLVATPCVISGQSDDSAGASSNPPAQNQSAPKRLTRTDSVVVGAHLTPEEIEEGKINDAYQPLYHLSPQTDCPQITSLCESKIIPMAESSKFAETRNKFLFLANRDIAGCEMKAGKYEEAEARYRKLFDYMSVWPGNSDSDYPINFSSIGTAQLAQGRWKDAIASLEKSVEIFDQQIEKALHSDSEFSRNEYSKHLKRSQASARELLAAAYFRDGQQIKAIEILEKAYNEALDSDAKPSDIQQIIDAGRAVAAMVGDSTLQEKWNARTVPQKNGQQ